MLERFLVNKNFRLDGDMYLKGSTFLNEDEVVCLELLKKGFVKAIPQKITIALRMEAPKMKTNKNGIAYKKPLAHYTKQELVDRCEELGIELPPAEIMPNNDYLRKLIKNAMILKSPFEKAMKKLQSTNEDDENDSE